MCPIYEYECFKCKDVVEHMTSDTEKRVLECEVCGKERVRIMSLCGWELKGDGWFNPHMPKKRARGGVGKK